MKTNCTMTRSIFGFIGMLLLVFAIAAQAQTPRFQISAFTDRGGGVSSGGAFTLNGSIGQSDASQSGGGQFALDGGFWPLVTGGDEGLPRLRIALVAGNVVLSWPNPSTGFQLQAAPAPLGPGWTTVPQAPVVISGENRVTLIPTGTGRMFRLSKP
jgi:hypothetical protein